MDVGILGWTVPAVGYTKEDVYCLSPPNRWTDRTGKPDAGNLPTHFRQLRSERLVPSAAIGQIRLQQLGHHGHQITPFYANYGYHPRTIRPSEQEVRNSASKLYA